MMAHGNWANLWAYDDEIEVLGTNSWRLKNRLQSSMPTTTEGAVWWEHLNNSTLLKLTNRTFPYASVEYYDVKCSIDIVAGKLIECENYRTSATSPKEGQNGDYYYEKRGNPLIGG